MLSVMPIFARHYPLARWSFPCHISVHRLRLDVVRLFATAQGHQSAQIALDLVKIDRKWQRIWQEQCAGAFNRNRSSDTGKAYVLPMFPYPSGNLHMGHIRVYTISDVLARFHYMRGKSVIHPMGWDAFGLPAENAAIERSIDPAIWTNTNIETMKGQLMQMNGIWDWNRELRTCDPEFYKHTQELFLMLYDKGLAYQKEALVNWDPVDQTVLANEQVDGEGRSWRSGAKVEQRNLRQWFFKITDFAQPLLDDLASLAQQNNWPLNVIQQQRNWLGRSEGTTLKFEIANQSSGETYIVNVFTTRADTLFGVKYLALSLQHPVVKRSATDNPSLQEYLETANLDDPTSKAGLRLEGLLARLVVDAPDVDGLDLPPCASESIPVFTAPYVLEYYGDGAVMGVPAHDQRDSKFWQVNGDGSKPRTVILPESVRKTEGDGVLTEKGILSNDCGRYSGMESNEAIRSMTQALGLESKVNWRLRDWLISRQRYWGTPIPIVHCPSCGVVPVQKSQLPVELPPQAMNRHATDGKLRPIGLDRVHEWAETECPRCSGPAKRETDTMDTFVDSSWYYYGFLNKDRSVSPFRSAEVDSRMPVDYYVGGVEHAILHLLYSRFIAKFIQSTREGGIKAEHVEPFSRLITQGMVKGKTYSDPSTGRFLKAEELTPKPDGKDGELIIKATSQEPFVSWEKMSKSKHNGVDPGTCIAQHGADAIRAHMLFAAPETDELQWDSAAITGVERWLKRVWKLVCGVSDMKPNDLETEQDHNITAQIALRRATLSAYSSITAKLTNASKLNTVVSDLMNLTRQIERSYEMFFNEDSGKDRAPSGQSIILSTAVLLRMMCPITPAFAEEAWLQLQHSSRSETSLILYEPWPTKEEIECIDEVNSSNSIQDPAKNESQSLAQDRPSLPRVRASIALNGKQKFTCHLEATPSSLLPLFSYSKEYESGPEDNPSPSQLRDDVLDLVFASSEAQAWHRNARQGAGRELFAKADRVVIVKGGEFINFVAKKPIKGKDGGGGGKSVF